MCVKYLEFWRSDLLAQSTTKDVAELLDALATSTAQLEPTFNALRLWNLPFEMLHKGLELHGESVGVDRVSAWLRTGGRSGLNDVRRILPNHSWRFERGWNVILRSRNR